MKLRLVTVAGLIVGGLLAAGPGVASAGEVKAPHWGDALFQFYQGRHFPAVTGLMASQQFERIGAHADEAEALRGGLLLSYGLHRDASDIFTRLAEQGMTPSVRDRAWFFLAKIRWQRGLGTEAEEALARVAAQLPPELEEERALLGAQLLLARADHVGAARHLTALASDPKATPYARFNLGVALLRSGDGAGGQGWLEGLGRAPADNEEQRSLRDKANLALGFAALQAEKPTEARKHLERVRLNGPFATKALLGFGWAAAAMKQPETALVPWQELLARDATDPAVLEARIAVPYALAELKAYGQAHDGYQAAIAGFDREALALDESVVALRGGKVVDALLERNPGADMGWLWRVKDLPELPHPAHMAPLLASHAFQEALKDQRDLRFLLNNLQTWARDLGVYGDMLDNRRKAYAERLPKMLAEARQVDMKTMSERRDAIAAAIELVRAAADGVALADAREQGLLQRIASVRAALKTLPADQMDESGKARERLRRADGALTWNLAQQQPARAWEAVKTLRLIDAELTAAKAREAMLVKAQRDEPAKFDRFAERITALSKRLELEIPRVAALQSEQQLALQEIAVTALLEHKARLAEYAAQARFAVAQLQDRATLSKAEDHAIKR